jgi:hypothetical protein
MKTPWLLSVVVIAKAFSATPIPEVISVGSYSVKAKLSEGTWAVEPFEKSETIRYSYAFIPQLRGEMLRVTVRRVTLPTEKISSDAKDFVRYLIQEDGLHFKQDEYGRGFHFTFNPDVEVLQAGTAYVYNSDSPIFKDPKGHFTAVALLLPADYRKRRVGYLVIGHQIGASLEITQLQVQFIRVILRGLREEASQPPDQTSGTHL